MNEEVVGCGIVVFGVDCKELFIMIKIWVENVSYKGVMSLFDWLLKCLGLDYIDLLLIY